MSSRVLIVDDDTDLRETLARLLGRFGHTCLLAASGSEAIGLMQTGSPDLVVTDLHMRGMDGMAVARQARQARPPIPVVLMTAYPMADTKRAEDSPTFHLAKPFANADMIAVVERALHGSRVAAGRDGR